MTTEAMPAPSGEDPLKDIVARKEAAAAPEAAKIEPVKTGTAKVGSQKTEAASSMPDLVAPDLRKSGSPDRPARHAAMLAGAKRLAGAARGAEPRLVAVAGSALVLGAILGAGATTLAGSRSAGPKAAITSLATAIDAGRRDTAKLAGAIAKLDQTVADLKAAAETARKDPKGGAMVEKLAQLDRGLTAKIAGLGERIDQAEKEQASRLAGLANRTLAARSEPTQTGSLPEARDKSAEAKPVEIKSVEAKPAESKPVAAKPAEVKIVEGKSADARQTEPARAATSRPPVLENYALRDIFEGAAIIEGRNRRLFQVAPGDTLPGVGRVEGIERQGRSWVVVTRQGVVTPQSW